MADKIIRNVVRFGISIIVLLTYACMGIVQTHGTPVRTENITQLIKGKSTKSDVIFLFGMPSGEILYGMAPIITSGDDKIYVYGQCKTQTKSRASAASFIPIVGLFAGGATAKSETACEQLAIMLDKNDIVKTYSYHPDDPVNEENTAKLINGKSTKSDVVELFGAPTTVSADDKEEIYMYEKCLGSSKVGTGLATFGVSSSSSCKKLMIMLDRNTEAVIRYSYQPYVSTERIRIE
ncbi:MAG: hypothetical protein HY805_02825 [Nitrospirae bacterium]|nr:hypothetical protein [Nitrospirota bacterium]